MDSLNSGLKPKKWKTQKNKELIPRAELTAYAELKKYSGNLTESKTSPPVDPPPIDSKFELISLFSTPILVCPCPSFNYDKELEWIRNYKFSKNDSILSGNYNETVMEERVKKSILFSDTKASKYDIESEIRNRCNRQSKDTFILDKPELANIRLFIERNLDKYVTEIMGSNSKIIITQSWLNKSGKGEYHHEHYHPNSIISGVWYPQIDEKLPPIQFSKLEKRDISLDISQPNDFNCTSFKFPLKQGELILFPSNISHCVPMNTFERERISLSFNTWVKGSFGDINSLTYVPIDRCV